MEFALVELDEVAGNGEAEAEAAEPVRAVLRGVLTLRERFEEVF
jgi:hypothetical protein